MNMIRIINMSMIIKLTVFTITLKPAIIGLYKSSLFSYVSSELIWTIFPIIMLIIILYNILKNKIINLWHNIHCILIKELDIVSNPSLPYKLLFIYRINLVFISICCVVSNDANFFLDIIYNFNINYYEELVNDCYLILVSDYEVNVKLPEGKGYWYNPTGDGLWVKARKAINPVAGGGPNRGGGGPSNNPLGLASAGSDEQRQKFDDYKFKMKYKKAWALKPKFVWFETTGRNKDYVKEHSPEKLHMTKPELFHKNTLRVYEEPGGLKYIYRTRPYYEEARICEITFPDGTLLITTDRVLVEQLIYFNQKNIAINNRVDVDNGFTTAINYHDWYKKHFDPFRRAKILAIIAGEQDPNYGVGVKDPNVKEKMAMGNLLNDPITETITIDNSKNDLVRERMAMSNLLNDPIKEQMSMGNLLNDPVKEKMAMSNLLNDPVKEKMSMGNLLNNRTQ